MPPIVATVRRKLFTSFYDDGDNRWRKIPYVSTGWGRGGSFQNFGNPTETNSEYATVKRVIFECCFLAVWLQGILFCDDLSWWHLLELVMCMDH